MSISGSCLTVSPVGLCVLCVSVHLEAQNDTNQLSVLLSGAVVAAEPKVQGLRKLPEDIEWSYTGLYEMFKEKHK